MTLKSILSFVIAVAAGSAAAIIISKLLGVEAVVPGVIGAVTGAVVVVLTSRRESRPPPG